jgi:hypothetical protein
MSGTPGVPASVEEVLSPQWLTAALGTRFPGVEVSQVVPGPVISRMSTNVRFRIDGTGIDEQDLPRDLCAKGYFTPAGRPARSVGIPEIRFYEEVAAATGVRTLRSVYADIDEATLDSVLITEDVVVSGATFLDGTSAYSVDQAAVSLAELARLHAATWASPPPGAWLDRPLHLHLSMRGLPEISANFAGAVGVGVPDASRDPERLVRAYRLLAERVGSEQHCVIHGDAHVGNVYLDGAGRPCFADWQLVNRGPWYLDVGYHIGSALTVEDRRGSERDLLDHYLAELRSHGAVAPSWEDAWLGLRLGVIHGLFLWAITLKVDPPIIRALLERLGTAAADHDSFAAVGA